MANSLLGQSDDGKATPSQDSRITLNLGDEVELKHLIDYVSLRLKINILYDEQVARKTITIRAPEKISEDSLLGLLESVLKMKGLALIEADQPGWMRVVPATNLNPIAKPLDSAQAKPTEVVSRIFHLEHAEPKTVESVLKAFLSDKGANTLSVDKTRILIVTDFAANFDRIERLVELADQAGPTIETRFIQARHVPAPQLAQQASTHIATKRRLEGETANTTFDLSFDQRTDQLIAVGTAGEIDEVAQFISSIDIPLNLSTKVYQFEAASPERIDRLTRELVGEQDAARLYRSVIDREARMLVVTATPEIHEQVVALKDDLDISLSETQYPIRSYKILHTTASDVLAIIQQIEGGDLLNNVDLTGIDEDAGQPTATGPQPVDVPSLFPEVQSNQSLRPIIQTLRTQRARVTAAPNTNSIIVIADPATHRVYEKLISLLDRRRPQVLLECLIVTLDTSDGYSLGVEISRAGGVDQGRYLTFSSFGLSEVDADSGALTLTPGVGFNGAIISADIADIIVKALKSNGRADVLSAPRLLINDNATGTLDSINEAPVTSINTFDTGATTNSFSGFVSAGTSISLTPHIAEGDHLRLEYSIALNSFGEGGSETVPPPRQTSSLASEVTIPDGHTIIVGGINRHDTTETIRRIPILGETPIIEHIFSDRSDSDTETSLFVFIRPIILRDDQFHDLRYLSANDLNTAGLPQDYPPSEPIPMP